MKDALTSERELLRRIAAGDGVAFRHLFDQYRQLVFGFAYTHLRTEALADEITQEVFIKIWIAGDKLTDIQSFEPWLRTVTRNLTYSYFRKVKQQRDLLDGYASALPEEGLDTTSQDLDYGEVRRLLHNALASLTDQQRTIFRMSREENMQYKDIAAALGITEYTVNYHLKKVLAHLRDVLGNNLYALLLGVWVIFS
ncbi:RNA polymerase sigma-70 factor [Chitinophaga horti]|uniref:RNA polymerase sigma factor n=1 Tax=Chitinophaga horti TaxID=2920382 RepID=A0ABY6JC27_9BACT|nr:RNA polymerase sigma-70 factor [Chitinophaga horti]UYQ95846.1 RNA polymerase sigma-70 factor [Chitinophaga horti]